MTRAKPMTRLGRLSVATSSVGTIVLAALVPKCPLCVAAALSAWGLGASAASTVAPAVRPVAFALMAVATTALIVFAVRRMRAEARSTAADRSCCHRHQRT
jgi:hypothetical protein